MRARPVKIVSGEGYVPCDSAEVTHLTLNIPGPTGLLTLPVQTRGTRQGTGNWTWNGSIDRPTLRPSVLTKGHDFCCHSWITDGQAVFLSDCSHEHVNKTLDLVEL